MRAYFFTNMYLSGTHPGIQAGHSLSRMWLKYSLLGGPGLQVLIDFEKSHQTWIVLRAGDHDSLWSLVDLLKSSQNSNPWAYFQEPGLNKAMTAVGIILPTHLYGDQCDIDTIKETEAFTRNYTAWERQFLKRRVGLQLAA